MGLLNVLNLKLAVDNGVPPSNTLKIKSFSCTCKMLSVILSKRINGWMDGWMDVRNLSKGDQVSTTYIPHRTPKSKLKQIAHIKSC